MSITTTLSPRSRSHRDFRNREADHRRRAWRWKIARAVTATSGIVRRHGWLHPSRAEFAAPVFGIKAKHLVSHQARLRRKEVAARYGISVRTLERRLKRRAFPRPSLIAGPVWALTDLEAAERDGHLPHPV